MRVATMCFGHSRFCLLLCKFDQNKNMTRCAGTRGVNGTREGVRITGGSSELMKYSGGRCNFQRAIPAAWGHDWRGNEVETGEEV
jgi:hypothetical protein